MDESIYRNEIQQKQHVKQMLMFFACIDKSFWEGKYDLNNRNCEHFANMIGFEINYSEQVYNNRTALTTRENSKALLAGVTFGTSLFLTGVPNTINNDKGSTVRLTDEINETNNKLKNSRSDHWQAKEIKKRYLQEIPPKEKCRVM